jgi:hypothetical protein
MRGDQHKKKQKILSCDNEAACLPHGRKAGTWAMDNQLSAITANARQDKTAKHRCKYNFEVSTAK